MVGDIYIFIYFCCFVIFNVNKSNQLTNYIYFQSTGGYEICDCYRVDSNPINITLTQAQVHRIPPLKENRHYYDPKHKISVKFFWFTGFPMVMNPMPTTSDFASIDASPEQWLHVIGKYDGTYEYRYDEINDLLYHQIRPRNPDLLVVNMGIWGSPGLSTLYNNQKNFTHYLKMSAKNPIWKTTTATTKGNFMDDAKQIELFKSEGLHIFDSYNVTWFMKEDWRYNFEDMFHFRPHAYKLINLHMLAYFKHILDGTTPEGDSPHTY